MDVEAASHQISPFKLKALSTLKIPKSLIAFAEFDKFIDERIRDNSETETNQTFR